MRKRQVPDDAGLPGPSARLPWWFALALCLTGLALSILLERIHFKIHSDQAFHSFCAVSRAVNCDIVARSPYAVFFGVPLAAWGIFGYVVAALVSLWGLCSRRPLLPAGTGLYLALGYFGVSVTLGGISALLVSAVCLLCIATYVANLCLLVCMIFAARSQGMRLALSEPLRDLWRRPLRWILALALAGVVSGALVAAHPTYWKSPASTLRTKPKAPSLPHGVEPGGGHFIGALSPAVTLTEFSDYECPFCRQAHAQLRAMVETYPTLFRLVHRHFPLDQSCNPSVKARMHENACFAAAIAECADRQDRFWQANDYLFAETRSLHARPNSEIARDIGLDASLLDACLREEGPRSVAIDIDEGNRLKIQGTPTFLVEGKSYTGTWPGWILNRLMGAAAQGDAGRSPDTR